MRSDWSPRRLKKSKLVRGGAWVFSGRFVNIALGLLVASVAGRVTTVPAFAYFVVSLAVISTLSTAMQLGLNQVLVRQLASIDDQSKRATLYVSLGLWTLGLSVAVLAMSVAGLIVSSGPASVAVAPFSGGGLAAASVALFAGGRALESNAGDAHRGREEFRVGAILNGNVGLVLLVVGLILTHVRSNSLLAIVDLTGPFLLAAVGSMLAGLVAMISLAGRYGSSRHPFTLARVRLVLGETTPIAVSATISSFLANADVWIVAWAVKSAQAVAAYGASSRLVLLVAAPLAMLNMVISPRVAALWHSGRHEDLRRILQGSALVAFLPTVTVLAVLALWPNAIVSGVFGRAIPGGATVLLLMLPGRFVAALTGSCGVALLMAGEQVRHMYTTVVSGVLRLLLVAVLGAAYGVAGAAVGATIGLALQNGLYWYLVRSRLGVWSHASFSGLRYS